MSSIVCNRLFQLPNFIRVIHSPSKVCTSPFMTANLLLNSKHWDPKWKKLRAKKVLKVNLPNFDEAREDDKLSIEELRTKLKAKGVAPTRSWNEKPMFIDASTDIFDPYIPPEGDGKISNVTSSNAMTNLYERFGKKSKSYLAMRKIRDVDYEFDVPTAAEKAKDVYIEAQKALAEKDEDKLHDLTTEKAFPEMMENVKNKTIVWNFIQCLEPPRVVHIRVTDMMSKKDKFAQITVRLHSQQTLAVYDRFGRLIHGSESTVKDVLEYLVFEKHITNPHGLWRIHGKIIPDWLPPRESIKRTYIRPDIDSEFPEPPKDDTPKEVSPESTREPAVATA